MLEWKTVLRFLAAALAVVVILPLFAASASAQTDPAKKRKQVQAKKAQVAAQLNVLKASDAEIERALTVLEANAKAHQARLADARRAADEATLAAMNARVEEQRTATKLQLLRRSMREVAVNVYVHGGQQQEAAIRDGTSPSELAFRQHMVEAVMGRGADMADELKAAGEDLADKRALADAAQRAANDRKKSAEAQAGQAKRALDEKERISSQVEARIDAALAEADSLSALDSQLAAQIAARQAKLARRIGPSSAPRGGGGGSRRVGAVSVTTVRGITVATSIAGNLERLLSAADGAGLRFGGNGYRSSDQQVATRRSNCGSSDYDVYEKPPSQCSPPTARPGSSMHEQGLAIDFTEGGRLLSRGSAGFSWLKSNGASYGFYNLPSEAWHWSTNGN